VTDALTYAALSAALSALLVGVVRRYAMSRAVLDLPTDRSSHRVPTPRGGGLGVVLACLGVFAFAVLRSGALSPQLVALLIAAGLVASIGWLDDHRPLAVTPRLLSHLVAGAVVAWLAGGAAGPFGVAGLAGAMWWILWTVSSINVTNFMDGIDGLIGLQALVFGVHVLLLGGPTAPTAMAGATLAGAAAGFLVWNWAPARIFLGDVGSGTLGLLLAAFGVLLQAAAGVPTAVAFLPLFPLFADAAVTLWRRWRRGERLTTAHRSHLYQRLANGGWGHSAVALAYGAAAAVGSGVVIASPAHWHTGLVLAYIAAVVLAGVWLEGRSGGRAHDGGQASP
jgi:Fuc2NAc and GlcNAc transferase